MTHTATTKLCGWCKRHPFGGGGGGGGMLEILSSFRTSWGVIPSFQWSACKCLCEDEALGLLIVLLWAFYRQDGVFPILVWLQLVSPKGSE